jgi:ferredoxin
VVPPHLHEQARLGARHCPEAAIVLVEDGDSA